MKPLAKLTLTRQRLYKKSCTDLDSVPFQQNNRRKQDFSTNHGEHRPQKYWGHYHGRANRLQLRGQMTWAFLRSVMNTLLTSWPSEATVVFISSEQTLSKAPLSLSSSHPPPHSVLQRELNKKFCTTKTTPIGWKLMFWGSKKSRLENPTPAGPTS